MFGTIFTVIGLLFKGQFVAAGREALKNGLVRAKVLGLGRDLAKTASGAVTLWLVVLLTHHGFDNATATTYGLALGGMISAFIMWLLSLALSWVDKSKVNVQLQAAAATGKVVPVAGLLKPANVNDVIAAAKAGNF